MGRNWFQVTAMAVVPVVGIMAAVNPTILSSAASSLPSLGAMFTSDDFASQMDGRIQAQGLLSSHFGMYGWPAQSFDYVIVGGGTAGLAMARRLSQDGTASVAVIEAGGFYETDAGNATEVPMERPWAEALHGGPCCTTGKPRLADISGSKVLTGRFRGSKGAYDMWADHVGDDSYRWDKWLPYFQKSVRFSGPETNPRPANATALNDNTAFTALGGPVHVGYPFQVNAISSWVDKALAKMGFPEAQGFSNGNLLGRSYITHTINPYTRRRETASSSYLREALMESNNLNIFTRTLVKRVLFDDQNRATGVTVSTDGFEWQIGAKKEVNLSAGVMRSPQLLMVSGIGPKEHLEQLGIPVRSDLSGVGQNMQDTIILGPTVPVKVESHSQLMGNKETLPRAIREYNEQRKGLLTNPGQDYFAFEKHQPGMLKESTAADIDAAFPDDWPTFSYIALDDTFVPQYDGKNYFSMSAALMTPFSRGTVTINSNDTANPPIVDPQWLADPRDQEMAVAAFRRCREIVASDVMREVVAGPEILPGPQYQTDEEILNYIAETSDAYYAGVGTCAMGKADDSKAVIDSKARVLGVKGLRVVDASIFPFAIDGQPMGTVYALAERIAAEMMAEQ
ncbi:unnamed protein product [Aspergillus oryzae]|nr:unnamed protein product [Aspergillus oryzae]